MNNITSYFLAQRIDNQENLHLMEAGHMLDNEDPRRSDVVYKITRVASDGKEVLSGNGFALFKWKTEYTIEIIPEEKDSEGRLAPILCNFDIKYIRKGTSEKKRSVDTIMYDIKCFLKKIKRTINDQTEREIEEALNKEIARKDPLLKKSGKFLSLFAPRANMPSYDNIAKDRLIEKLDYEIWLLEYISKTQVLFQGGADISTIRLNNKDKVATVDVKIQEHVGAGHAIQIIDSIAPLVFASSYKVLDMIFEWILEENRNSGIISKVPWKFCEKVSLISSTNLKYPPLFISNPYLEKYTFAFFKNLLPYRNEIIHNHNFSVSEEKITLFDSKSNNRLVLDRTQLGCLVRIVVATAKALSGNLNFDKFVDCIFKYHLDQLTALHNKASFRQKCPLLLNVELTVLKEEDIFHADLKFVRETIQKIYPYSDVVFNLIIIDKNGEMQLVKWFFPAENVPTDDILSLKYDSYPEFLMK